MSRPNVILDTDFSSDVDDCGDLGVCLGLHKMGMINFIGVIVSSTNSQAPGAVSAVIASHGMQVPIGVWKGAAIDPQAPSTWTPTLYTDYTRYVNLASSVDDALDVYRSLLATHDSVKIVLTGFANCLAQLLAAEPALVAAKVSDVCWAAGDYPSSAGEFNISSDQTSAAAFVNGWPNMVTYSGYTNGLAIISGNNLKSEFTSADPMWRAYQLHWTAGAGRSAWGQLPVLWVAYGLNLFSTVRGTNTIVGNGNSFTASPSGRDYYIVPRFSPHTYVNLINSLLNYPRAGARTRWPYANAVISFI